MLAALVPATLAVLSAGSAHAAPAVSAARSGGALRAEVAKHLGDQRKLSAGAKMWLDGPPQPNEGQPRVRASIALGSNVDANDPNRDLVGGQSETAIAAQRTAAGKRLVLAGWNDASGFVGSPTTTAGSLTGVGLSPDGGAHFVDLVGLPNNNVDQQWSGDPAIASLGDGSHFAVASLYFPSAQACTDGLPSQATVAVSIATVNAAGTGATFTAPTVVARSGDICTIGTDSQPADLAELDKDWISYDPVSRRLAVSYTRFYLPPIVCGPVTCEPTGPFSGNGQIETATATVPANPANLTAAAFARPVAIWPEEPNCPAGTPSSPTARCGAFNQGAYVAVARGGVEYVSWERNLDSNTFNGDPYVYIHAARLAAWARTPSAGGPGHPVILSKGQPNGNTAGGVKGLNNTFIAGYSRGTGNDFPRIALLPNGTPVVAWNDSSRHPLGDIYLRAASAALTTLSPIRKVNDDNSFALHFLPAVSVRADGTICTSWYDRRRSGPTSTLTDYFADCRTAAGTNGVDKRITTGSTDWAGTSSAINPNFGDYTDSATDGTRTYYTWSDGRLGIPQPFVDHS
jgi:hypothetical protein